MFQSLILPMKIGVSYGSGALKALQNDNIPELDLLVREAIQNSSDAAINQPEDSCNINFTQGSFSSEAFNALLPDIGHILNRRYGKAISCKVKYFRICSSVNAVISFPASHA